MVAMAGAPIRSRMCSFELDDRGFVVARIDRGATMALADAIDCIERTFEVAGHVRRPVLVDMSGIRAETREARLYFASDEAVARYAAVAVLVSSPMSRVIGNFFMRLTQHRRPTQLFSVEADAVAWLLEHRA
jgi:uncharacterized protein (UPF0262 family)